MFCNKLFNRLNIIKKEFLQDGKYFSFELAFVRMLSTMLSLLRLNKLSNIFQNKKNEIVLNYINNNYGYVFNDTTSLKTKMDNESFNSKCIWVCWLDGIESAPDLVKRCLESIKEHANGYDVKIITKYNMHEYVELPEYLYDKFENKQIGNAHFSDILRICLLEKHGGLWLDSTIFCSKDIPKEYFEYDLFTCKDDRITPGCVSNNKWTTFCIGGKKNHVLFSALKNFFFEYWKYEECAVDYLFFDDAIYIAYSSLRKVKQDFDIIPFNNTQRDELIKYFNEPWEDSKVLELLKGETVFYKLGYREKQYLNEYDAYGNETVYKSFINRKF